MEVQEPLGHLVPRFQRNYAPTGKGSIEGLLELRLLCLPCWNGGVNRGTQVGYGGVIDLDPMLGEKLEESGACLSGSMCVATQAGGARRPPARCCLVGAK